MAVEVPTVDVTRSEADVLEDGVDDCSWKNRSEIADNVNKKANKPYAHSTVKAATINLRSKGLIDESVSPRYGKQEKFYRRNTSTALA